MIVLGVHFHLCAPGAVKFNEGPELTCTPGGRVGPSRGCVCWQARGRGERALTNQLLGWGDVASTSVALGEFGNWLAPVILYLSPNQHSINNTRKVTF